MAPKDQYSTSDPSLAAFIRLRGHGMTGVFPDPERPRRMRVSLDLSDADGRDLELQYRNSEFKQFQALQEDTIDAIKRR